MKLSRTDDLNVYRIFYILVDSSSGYFHCKKDSEVFIQEYKDLKIALHRNGHLIFIVQPTMHF